MLGLEVKSGDAILFTEALRHDGFTNHKYETWKRYNTEQKEQFQPWLRQGTDGISTNINRRTVSIQFLG